ncbi:ABC transporter ATP-binding protein [Halobacteriovorax sp. GB3]|uniref:ABC transporter ATP-binding protein n=1 Tax=Halobacteriovorax sp. GB3 TaxID=2719615 RepID=UPI00235E8CA3|nr:ABC transporter ATP-binding protein [Halobacteriovorax sp. GB3]MDD0854605.1 ABC transporter ATP-binding protein [Halobacteriovorax sp. GB3]
MIHFNEVLKTFKSDFWSKEKVVLDKVSFEIPQGKVIGFLGANGAGKTTSIKILMDFIKPKSGTVVFSKELGNNDLEIKKNIGYLPEHPYFYPYLTGREFAKYLLELNGLKIGDYNDQLIRWTKKLLIDHALDQKIRSYSKGMLQRLGFVVAILHSPKFLVLDEPLSGVDPIGRSVMKDAIRELNAKGMTIFFSSHIVSDLEEVCSDVIFLERGKVLFNGSKDELLKKDTDLQYSVILREKDKLIEKVFNEEDKNIFLKEAIKNNKAIERVEAIVPTLEEVVYKLKK